MAGGAGELKIFRNDWPSTWKRFSGLQMTDFTDWSKALKNKIDKREMLFIDPNIAKTEIFMISLFPGMSGP